MDIYEAAAQLVRYYLGHRASEGEIDRLAERLGKALTDEFKVNKSRFIR